MLCPLLWSLSGARTDMLPWSGQSAKGLLKRRSIKKLNKTKNSGVEEMIFSLPLDLASVRVIL